MKRTILVIAVIAFVAVAVFGSQALADKPETIPSNVAMNEILGSINQTVTDTQIKVADIEYMVANGSAVVMETFTTTGDLTDGLWSCPFFEYPEVGHISLTIVSAGCNVSEVLVAGWINDNDFKINPLTVYEEVDYYYSYTYEFDGNGFWIAVWSDPCPSAFLEVVATITYQR
jgi:hypothetical protein